jgi:hypothetical protein
MQNCGGNIMVRGKVKTAVEKQRSSGQGGSGANGGEVACRKFINKLGKKNEKMYRSKESQGLFSWLEQAFPEPWLYVAELIQNAVDAGAKALRFVPGKDSLVFEHDGRTFDQNDVKGLCSLGLSSKGFGTLGFMGIGFKAVFHTWERVSVASAGWHFSLEVPTVKGPRGARLKNWPRSVVPNWEKAEARLSNGMNCRFLFEGRRADGQAQNDLAGYLGAGDALWALLALRGVRTVCLGDQKWALTVKKQRGRAIIRCLTVVSYRTANYRWLAVTTTYSPSDEAVKQFVQYRGQVAKHADEAALNQRRSATLLCRLDDEGVPSPSHPGLAYGFLPTVLPLPLGAHVNADWLLDVTRREPRDLEGNPWHEDIRSQIPRLLGDFVEWVVEHHGRYSDRLRQALEVLPDLESAVGDDEQWMLGGDFVPALKKRLAAIPFVRCLHDKERQWLTPKEARFLPEPLAERTSQPELCPGLLFGPEVGDRNGLGERATKCLGHMNLFRELRAGELKKLWDGGRVGRWAKQFNEEIQNEHLSALYAGLAELAKREVGDSWGEAELRCIPSVTGKWLTKGEAVRLPSDWTGLPDDDLRARLRPFVAESEDCLVREELGKSQYLMHVPRPDLEVVAEKWWKDLPGSSLDEPLIQLVLDLSLWALHENRRGMVQRYLCRDDGGSLRLCQGSDCLLEEPYAGDWRKRFFPKLPAVADRYPALEGSPNAAQWRAFFERGGVPPMGAFKLEVRANRISPQDAQNLAEQELDLIRGGGTRQWHGLTLSNNDCGQCDFLLPESVEGLLEKASVAPEEARDLGKWLSEGGFLPGSSQRWVAWLPYGTTQWEDKKQLGLSSWVTKLQEGIWVMGRDGKGPYAPEQVLPQHDPARPEAPVADLPQHLVSSLVNAGVGFGTAVEQVPAIRRLRAEGPTAMPARVVELVQAALEQAGASEPTLAELQQAVLETPLFDTSDGNVTPDGLTRVPGKRLVTRAGIGGNRSRLAGWVVAIVDYPVDATARRSLAEKAQTLIKLPATTTGEQTLDFLKWVWANQPEEVSRISDALPLAYSYLLEDLPQDGPLCRAFGLALSRATVFTRSKHWVGVADAYLDDLPDDLPEKSLPPAYGNLELATGGHLAHGRVEQAGVAERIGLRLLSRRFQIGVTVEGDKGSVPPAWQSVVDRLWRLFRLGRAARSGETARQIPVEKAPSVFRCSGIIETIRDNEAAHDDDRVSSRSPDARFHDGKVWVAGEPEQFTTDLCLVLVERAGREVPDRLKIEAGQLLQRIGEGDGGGQRLSQLEREYGESGSRVPEQGDGDLHGTSQEGSEETSAKTGQEDPLPGGLGSAGRTSGAGRRGVSNAQLDSGGAKGADASSQSPAGCAASERRERTGSQLPVGSDPTALPLGRPSSPPTDLGASYTSEDRASRIKYHRTQAENLEFAEVNPAIPGVPSEQQSTGTCPPRSDEPFRKAVLAYEQIKGRFPVARDPMQPGHDVDSFSAAEGDEHRSLVRRIEVKGRNRPWTDAEIVVISDRQFKDALVRSAGEEEKRSDDFDYWVYVVELGDWGYCVIPLRNPAAALRSFALRADVWRRTAEEEGGITQSQMASP